MSYAKPLYTVEQVNAAGRLISAMEASREDLYEAVEIIDNWRASHAFPLNTFQVTLKKRALKSHSKAISAQRIKRLESIGFKLTHSGDMKLSQMQDIGGCRAVLPTLKHVAELRNE
jgi:hypothetical protein